MLDGKSGIVLAVDEWQDVLSRISTPDGKLALALDDMLAEVGKLGAEPIASQADFPFVLSAGERRSFTANTIIRDPAWRKKDGAGALRISPEDAAALGVASGDRLQLITERGRTVVSVEVSDTMQPRPRVAAERSGPRVPRRRRRLGGIAPNELTAAGGSRSASSARRGTSTCRRASSVHERPNTRRTSQNPSQFVVVYVSRINPPNTSASVRRRICWPR